MIPKPTPKKIKTIAMVTPSWPEGSSPNGIVNYTAKMRKALQDLGIRVLIFTGNVRMDDPDEDVIDLSQYRINKKSICWRGMWRIAPGWCHQQSSTLPKLRALAALPKDKYPDIFEMHDGFGTSRLFQQKSKIPVVVRLHGPWFLNGAANGVVEDHKYYRRVYYEGEAIKKAAGVTSPSQETLTLTEKKYNCKLLRAKVIPNLITDSGFPKWDLKACEPYTILFVGRFDNHKGGDIVVEAFAKVLNRVPQATLFFVGSDNGIKDHNGEKVHFELFANNLIPNWINGNNLIFLGKQPHEALNAYRGKAMVTVMASRWENFPYTILEALSFGSPIVATDSGGTPEIIKHDKNGLLCEPNNSEDMADKILELLHDPARAMRLGRQAANDAKEIFGPKRLAKETLDFYEEVLEAWRQKHQDK